MADKKSLLDVVRDLYEKDGRDAIWDWCMAPEHAHGKAKRFNVAVRFARNRRDDSTGDERKGWADARKVYAKNRDKWEAEYEEQHSEAQWPDDLNVAELLYESAGTPNAHCHLASPEREKLIAIGTIARDEFGLRVGEFPPFDHTEGVHTGVSWHYRDPSKPYVGVTYSQAAAHLNLGGDWGCAMDLNDTDGGNDQEYAFYLELRRRYQ